MDEADSDTDAAADANADPVAALADLDGWRAEGFAARVHYRGADERYSVEFYRPSECVLYWKVKGDGETAVPVSRSSVPSPLRERVRRDLADVGVDPELEAREV